MDLDLSGFGNHQRSYGHHARFYSEAACLWTTCITRQLNVSNKQNRCGQSAQRSPV
jgi:hypothetical protein